MPQYSALFRVAPRYVFGIPQDGITIFPATSGKFHGPIIDTSTGNIMAYGTLSQPRLDDQAINETFTIGGTQCWLRDDFLKVTIDADNDREALNVVYEAAHSLIQWLSLYMRLWLSAILVQLVSDDAQQPVNLAQFQLMLLGRVSTYNLDRLREHIRESAVNTVLDDHTLSLALEYFNHALFIKHQFSQIMAPEEVPSKRHLAAASILNFYKVITTIAGDPSCDRDHQSRYKKYGITKEFYRDNICAVKQLRDDSDVAHHRQPDEKVPGLKDIGFAEDTAHQVVLAYTDYLRNQKGWHPSE